MSGKFVAVTPNCEKVQLHYPDSN